MQPYVIRQGDYVAKLAYSFGFDADAVWNDDKNAELRGLRPDPNILLPGDILYIPDDASPPPQNLETGTTNNFVADVPTTSVTVTFADPGFASQSCSVSELEHLSGLSTDGDGILTFAAPVTLEVTTIVFDALNVSCTCSLGHLDPVDTLSGAFQRLQNLGYIDQSVAFDATDLGIIRRALRALRAAGIGGANGDGADASDVGGTEAPSSAAAGGDAPAPDDCGQGPVDPGDPHGAAADDGTAPATDASDEAPLDAPSASSVASEPVDQAVPDDGISDDGHVDEPTRALLVSAHGC